MKDECEECGATPAFPEFADEDLVECYGCGKTICINDCVWSLDDDPERYWCFDCTEKREVK